MPRFVSSYLKFLVILLLLTACQDALMAQKKETAPLAVAQPMPPVSDSSIQKLFSNGVAVKWIKRLKGRIDDVYLIDLVLGSDGRNCKGYLTYVKSKTRFSIQGPLDNGQLSLEERDLSGNVTGQIKGSFDGTKLNASWTNKSNTVGSKLDAEELQAGQAFSSNCSENKWAARYITRYNGGRADMVLIRMHNGALEGFLWIEADKTTYALKGELKENGLYDLEALLPNGKTGGLLEGSLANPAAIVCNWIGSGERRSFSFSQKDRLVFGCLDFADFRSGFDAVYPRTACIPCNNWLDQQVNNWMSACKSAVAAISEPLNAETRGKYRAGSWADIACWTETILSGYLTFTDTWNPEATGKAFNFNLKTGKEIIINDLFVKSFDPKPWFEAYWKREAPKLRQFAADPKYRAWIDQNGFPLIAIRREGLELSTLFHPVYGQQHLIVPYAELKANIKKDNPIVEFLK